jgi:hypothetical protein
MASNGDDERKPVTYIPETEDKVEDLYGKGCNMGINFKKYFEIPVKVTGPRYTPKKLSSFTNANLDPVVRGEFHDWGDAEWIVIRSLSGHNDTPCGRPVSGRPIGHPGSGRPQGVFDVCSYY